MSSPPSEQLELCAPVPVEHVDGTHFLQLTAAGMKGIQVTSATAEAVDAAVCRAVAQQLHQWFEVDDRQKNVDAYFDGRTVCKILKDEETAASCRPGPAPERWRLAGLEFSESTGRFSYRIEPDAPQKLKLRTDTAGTTPPPPVAHSSPHHPHHQCAPPVRYRAGTPAVRRDHTADPAAAKAASTAPPQKDVLALAASEAAAEEYLREYTAAIEQARQIRMDASRRFMEKMGVADGNNNNTPLGDEYTDVV
jgi:hypothetical protein